MISTRKLLYKVIQKLDEVSLNKIYPVGSIYMSVSPTEPSALFGGTWERWGNGKVAVGVDETDTSFSTVENTGGSKNAINVSHTHDISSVSISSSGGHSHTVTAKFMENYGASGTARDLLNVNGTKTYTSATTIASGTGTHTHTVPAHATKSSGSSGTNQNLQPYITCYMWKRTA